MAIAFVRDFDPAWGEAVEILPGIRRVTANNPGSFTFRGTNSFLVGTSTLTVIDPGPDDPAHLQAILRAAGGRPISHVLVTHTHRDHSPLASRLAEKTGAIVAGCGPHQPARPLADGETAAMDASADRAYRPELLLGNNDLLDTPAAVFEAVATPGHTANHLAFALPDAGVVFTGDHVMGWSTTIVAPPDGSMADYIASLDRLGERPERRYLPAHGGPIDDGPGFATALKAHRLNREAAVLKAISEGARSVPEIVATVYRDTDRALWGAAGLAVLAHLEWLVEKGAVTSDPVPPRLDGRVGPRSVQPRV